MPALAAVPAAAKRNFRRYLELPSMYYLDNR